MNHTPSKWISSALALGLAITPALAQNPNYAPGDLVLFLQKAGGTNTVYANLGNAATVFRGGAAGPDVPNKTNFLNINAALNSAFGSTWATDPTIYAGLAAVASTSGTSSALVNGDPPRTLYVSKPRTAAGTLGTAGSAPWIMLTDTQMSAGANGILAQNNKLETLYTTAVAVSPTSDSTIDDQNPFTAPGIQAPAFGGAFDGGVQQVGGTGDFGTVGSAGAVHFALDLYRILARTGIAGQVGGTQQHGTYEGTVTINSSGLVSFITQPSYVAGDLVLYFQKPGNTNTIYAGLGNAATVFRSTAAGPDAPNKVNFLDLSATLASAFGAGWATDTSLYAGLAAVASTSATSSVLVNGDPPRTLYVSKPRNTVGTVGTANSAAWIMLTDTQMSAGANGILAQNNKLATLYPNPVAVSPTSDSTIDDQNPFTAPGIQAPALGGAFDGGVQQVGGASDIGPFGAAGSVHFALDLYRILALNNVVGQVAGTLLHGSFEGTVTVNSSGQVSFIAQGAPYDNWMRGFPSITDPNAKLPTADPDNDGMTNLMEFVLNGNPGISDSAAIAPTLNTSGSNFVFSFTRRQDSVALATQVFQYGTDLAGWTSVTIGATGGVVGSATIAVGANGTGTDGVTVTIPKSVAIGGKLFGRLKVSQ